MLKKSYYENECILHIIEGTEKGAYPRYKYTQNASLFTAAPYILNNLVIHQN